MPGRALTGSKRPATDYIDILLDLFQPDDAQREASAVTPAADVAPHLEVSGVPAVDVQAPAQCIANSAHPEQQQQQQQAQQQVEPRDPDQVFSETMNKLLASWTRPRIKHDWSAAVWRPQLCAAEVVLKNSKFIDRMGYMLPGRRMLYIEEAMYLVARSDLVLFVENESAAADKDGDTREATRALSLQESHNLLVQSGFPVEAFQVYSHLSRAGYIVYRYTQHPPEEARTLAHQRPLPPPPPQQREAALLARLQAKMPNLRHMQQADVDVTADQPHEVVFNVFKPKSQFSRKKSLIPDYRVMLAWETLPSTAAIAVADAGSGVVPLLYAIVNQGDVDYFNLCRHQTPLVWNT